MSLCWKVFFISWWPILFAGGNFLLEAIVYNVAVKLNDSELTTVLNTYTKSQVI